MIEAGSTVDVVLTTGNARRGVVLVAEDPEGHWIVVLPAVCLLEGVSV
jgi:hypothetical protein